MGKVNSESTLIRGKLKAETSDSNGKIKSSMEMAVTTCSKICLPLKKNLTFKQSVD